MAEAPPHLLIGAAQRGVRIDIEMAREIDDDEEQVANLVAQTLRRTIRSREFLLDLADLLAHLGENGMRVVPVEADRRRLLLQRHSAS